MGAVAQGVANPFLPINAAPGSDCKESWRGDFDKIASKALLFFAAFPKIDLTTWWVSYPEWLRE
jgi:hypothetical protein